MKRINPPLASNGAQMVLITYFNLFHNLDLKPTELVSYFELYFQVFSLSFAYFIYISKESNYFLLFYKGIFLRNFTQCWYY